MDVTSEDATAGPTQEFVPPDATAIRVESAIVYPVPFASLLTIVYGIAGDNEVVQVTFEPRTTGLGVHDTFTTGRESTANDTR